MFKGIRLVWLSLRVYYDMLLLLLCRYTREESHAEIGLVLFLIWTGHRPNNKRLEEKDNIFIRISLSTCSSILHFPFLSSSFRIMYATFFVFRATPPETHTKRRAQARLAHCCVQRHKPKRRRLEKETDKMTKARSSSSSSRSKQGEEEKRGEKNERIRRFQVGDKRKKRSEALA